MDSAKMSLLWGNRLSMLRGSFRGGSHLGLLGRSPRPPLPMKSIPRPNLVEQARADLRFEELQKRMDELLSEMRGMKEAFRRDILRAAQKLDELEGLKQAPQELQEMQRQVADLTDSYDRAASQNQAMIRELQKEVAQLKTSQSELIRDVMVLEDRLNQRPPEPPPAPVASTPQAPAPDLQSIFSGLPDALAPSAPPAEKGLLSRFMDWLNAPLIEIPAGKRVS